jgi:hypothetical protein
MYSRDTPQQLARAAKWVYAETRVDLRPTSTGRTAMLHPTATSVHRTTPSHAPPETR